MYIVALKIALVVILVSVKLKHLELLVKFAVCSMLTYELLISYL